MFPNSGPLKGSTWKNSKTGIFPFTSIHCSDGRGSGPRKCLAQSGGSRKSAASRVADWMPLCCHGSQMIDLYIFVLQCYLMLLGLQCSYLTSHHVYHKKKGRDQCWSSTLHHRLSGNGLAETVAAIATLKPLPLHDFSPPNRSWPGGQWARTPHPLVGRCLENERLQMLKIVEPHTA